MTYAFARTYFDKIAVVIFNKSSVPRVIKVSLPDWFAGTSLKANFGSEFEKDGVKVSVTLPANSFEILTN
jgi:hypothetical protein